MKTLSLLFITLLFTVASRAQEVTSAARSFEGVWVGDVVAPNAKAALAIAFVPGKEGLTAQLTMPTMFVSRLNLGPAAIADNNYTMSALGIQLTLRGDVLAGTFANPLLRVELHRGNELPPLMPPSPAPAGPKPAWTKDVGATLWATPVVYGEGIYIGSTDGKFHALRAEDGSEVWTWSGPNPLFGEALVTKEAVYFLDDAGDCIALARATGQLRWRTELHEEKPATKNPTFNHRTAVPVAGGDGIYVGSGSGRIYALAPEDGKIRWDHNLGAPIYAAVALDGDELLACGYDGTVITLNRHTRTEAARIKVGGPIASAPVVAGDIVLIGCRDYLLYGLRRSDLTVVWRDSFWFSWVESVPRVVSGIAYIGGSDYRRISAIEPASGVARWATDIRGLTWGTPVVTENTVYAGSSAQDPAAINHQGGITALDRDTGRVKWHYGVPLPAGADRAGYLGSLALAHGRIIGAGYDGTIVALPTDEKAFLTASQ